MSRPTAALCLLLAACGTTYAVPPAGPGREATPMLVREGPGRSAADFARVAARVEPAAEAFCREEAPGAPQGYCDFRILLEADPRMPPNAFQTRSSRGRPVVVVSASLLAEMRSDDELAFVLAHETGHHVAQHIPKQQQSQMLGAMILGGLASATAGPGGVSEQTMREMMDLGAFVGGRAYSQNYELEADVLGAYISARAGYDPERGAQIFGRPALAASGGPVILSSHPASPRRLSVVQSTAAEIRRQQAAGLAPRPAAAGRALF
jgi:predicted Zn-dependent protease